MQPTDLTEIATRHLSEGVAALERRKEHHSVPHEGYISLLVGNGGENSAKTAASGPSLKSSASQRANNS